MRLLISAGLVFTFFILLQGVASGDEGGALIRDAEIQEILESINNWDRVSKVLAWNEGRTSEVDAVTGARVLQKARFTVKNGRLTRCYECLPKVTARVDSDRIYPVLEHIRERNIPMLVYDASKIWFRIAFDEASAGESYIAPAGRRVEDDEVKRIIESINTWDKVKPILLRNDGKVSKVSIVSGEKVYQSGKFTVRRGVLRRCTFCIADVDVKIDASEVDKIITHIKQRNTEVLYEDASRVWFRIGIKGMTKIIYERVLR